MDICTLGEECSTICKDYEEKTINLIKINKSEIKHLTWLEETVDSE